MTRKQFALSALLLAFTLVVVPACGGEEEPAKPDVVDPGTPPAGDPVAKAPDTPATKTWALNAESLKGYVTTVTDLKDNAPKALKDVMESALAMVKGSKDMSFGKKATAILEKHGFTQSTFNDFSHRLWTATLAAAPDAAGSAASGLGALAGENAGTIKGVSEAVVKEYTKDVTAEDKAFALENLGKITALLK